MCIRDSSYITLIDYRDFRAGALSIDEMEKAVIGSRHTLLVLTPNYLASVWSKFENVMAQSLDPAAITRKVIPVLREDCDICLLYTSEIPTFPLAGFPVPIPYLCTA